MGAFAMMFLPKPHHPVLRFIVSPKAVGRNLVDAFQLL